MTERPDEPDRQPGCAHPRETYALFGHEAAEQALAEAHSGARTHHAWLIAGPRGVGKATLAYRAARRFLGAASDPGQGALGADPADPVCRRIEAQAHSNLLVLRRPWDEKRGRWRAELTIEEARRAPNFFSKSAGTPGWRVAIIDSVDDMNTNAANGLLKTLEEPPDKGILFLVAHAPGRLPATIRSRCRRLDLRAPGPEATAAWLETTGAASGREAEQAANLAEGAPGRALALAATGAVGLDADISALLAGLPSLDPSHSRAMAARLSGKAGEGLRPAFYELLARRIAGYAREAGRAQRDAGPWTHAWRDVNALVREADVLYLDPKQTALAVLARVQQAARESA